MRCAYLENGAVLEGFTLTNGYTFSAAGLPQNQGGGGAYVTLGAVVSNCVITACGAREGGGIRCFTDGHVVDSVVAGNQATISGGGILLGTGSSADRCIVRNNNAAGGGGIQALNAAARNGLVYSNTANTAAGIGGNGSQVDNCTVVFNQASINGGGLMIHRSTHTGHHTQG